MKSSRQDLEMALDRLHEDYQHLREQLAAATRGEPFWSLFGWGKSAKAKRAAHAEETVRTISVLKDQLSAANYAHHQAEAQCVRLEEKIAALETDVAYQAEWAEMYHKEFDEERKKVAAMTAEAASLSEKDKANTQNHERPNHDA